jgi:hypothetical protein
MRGFIASLLLMLAGCAHAGWTTLEISNIQVELVQLGSEPATIEGTTAAEVKSWLTALEPDRNYFDNQLHGTLGVNTGLRIAFDAAITLNAYRTPNDDDFVWYRGDGRLQSDEYADYHVWLGAFDWMLFTTNPLDGGLETQSFSWSVDGMIGLPEATPFTLYWSFSTVTNSDYPRPVAEVPEPSTSMLLVGGLLLVAANAQRARVARRR